MTTEIHGSACGIIMVEVEVVEIDRAITMAFKRQQLEEQDSKVGRTQRMRIWVYVGRYQLDQIPQLVKSLKLYRVHRINSHRHQGSNLSYLCSP